MLKPKKVNIPSAKLQWHVDTTQELAELDSNSNIYVISTQFIDIQLYKMLKCFLDIQVPLGRNFYQLRLLPDAVRKMMSSGLNCQSCKWQAPCRSAGVHDANVSSCLHRHKINLISFSLFTFTFKNLPILLKGAVFGGNARHLY